MFVDIELVLFCNIMLANNLFFLLSIPTSHNGCRYRSFI